MKVSALIPTYNRRDHTIRAVDSVLAQTLAADEVIVVDDGSTDGTVEALRSRYGPQITVISQTNSGVSAARTRAAEEAHGEWLAFLDSDDVWLPTKLEKQLDAITALGPEFGACFTNCSYFGDPTLRLTAFEEAGMSMNPAVGEVRDPIQYILGTELAIYVQSLMVRKSLFHEVKGFDPNLGISEDRDLIFRLSFKTRFCFVAAPLVSIDRTSSLPRLTGLLDQKDDQSYSWLVLMREKWLAYPGFADYGSRSCIEKQLTELYYAWASERIGQLEIRSALKNVRTIRGMGQSYLKIILILGLRGARKAWRVCAQLITRVKPLRTPTKAVRPADILDHQSAPTPD